MRCSVSAVHVRVMQVVEQHALRCHGTTQSTREPLGATVRLGRHGGPRHTDWALPIDSVHAGAVTFCLGASERSFCILSLAPHQQHTVFFFSPKVHLNSGFATTFSRYWFWHSLHEHPPFFHFCPMNQTVAAHVAMMETHRRLWTCFLNACQVSLLRLPLLKTLLPSFVTICPYFVLLVPDTPHTDLCFPHCFDQIFISGGHAFGMPKNTLRILPSWFLMALGMSPCFGTTPAVLLWIAPKTFAGVHKPFL